MDRPKALLAWSSGKDSAFALHVVREEGAVEVVGLLTTVNDVYDRVAMHGVRRALLSAQAEAAGLPLTVVTIPSPCPNEVYEARMDVAMRAAKAQGIEHVVFGDLFLADIRAYRERQLSRVGMQGVFPLWLRDTSSLARAMIESGLRAHVVCIDPTKLDRRFAGRTLERRSSPICRPASIRVARTGSSIRSPSPVRCSLGPWPAAPASSWSATVSCSPTWFRPRRFALDDRSTAIERWGRLSREPRSRPRGCGPPGA